jgi:hypothetical protein
MKITTFLLVVFVSLGWLKPAIANNLHIILVGDTNVSDIGDSVAVDIRRMQQLASIVASSTGLRLNLQTIIGNNVTPNNVRQSVSKLRLTSNDVVFFYWSGHGYNRGKSYLPTMSIQTRESSNVDLKEIADSIQAKKPRLYMVIGDTCNVKLNQRYVHNTAQATSRSSTNYKDLFLNHRGHILAAGSEVGGYSWGSGERGGVYTSALLRSLAEELALTSGTPSWQRIMNKAGARVRIRDGVYQQPVYSVNVTRTNNFSSSANPVTGVFVPNCAPGTCPDDKPAVSTCSDHRNPDCW